MEARSFLLSHRSEERRFRRDLILFLETVCLYVRAGFDLAFAWPEALSSLESSLEARLVGAIRPLEGETLVALLDRLAREYPTPGHRHWFRALHGLYSSGAPLVDAVGAVANAMRSEQRRELDTHARLLPTRLNVALLLFFLPAAFLLLFTPLVLEILQGFPR